MKNIADLRKGVTGKDILDKIKSVSLDVLMVKTELLSSGKKENNKKTKTLLKNFIKEIKGDKNLNYFRSMKQGEQVQILIDTAFLIINRK